MVIAFGIQNLANDPNTKSSEDSNKTALDTFQEQENVRQQWNDD